MATRGSRLRFRTLRLPSSELIRMRSSSTAIQTGELLGEPSGMMVDTWAKLGRESSARTGGSSFMVRTSAKLYALRRVGYGLDDYIRSARIVTTLLASV